MGQEAILEPELPIIDPHHHLWDRRAVVASLPPPKHGFEHVMRRAPRYLLDELLADMTSGHNVRATVYVECGSMYRADGPERLRPVGLAELGEAGDEFLVSAGELFGLGFVGGVHDARFL